MEVKRRKFGDVKVAYFGRPGTFSEQAAIKYFDSYREKLDLVAVGGTDAVFEAVQDESVDYGVLPIENSKSGAIFTTYDALLKHHLYIVGEVAREEQHCLCVLEHVEKKDVKRVYSHPHILAQCSSFLDALSKENGGDELEQLCTSDSVSACLRVKKGQEGAAVICSAKAASLHGLKILASDIADHSPIVTRYIVLGRTEAVIPPIRHPVLKSSLCILLRNEVGSAFKVLSCFAFRHLNVLRIQTRPTSTAPREVAITAKHWESLFYIDFVPSEDQATNEALLANLREFSLRVIHFGTYEKNLPDTEVKAHWNVNVHI